MYEYQKMDNPQRRLLIRVFRFKHKHTNTKMGFIYLITCDVSPKVYVGQTINPINKRWGGHKACAKQLIKYIENPTENVRDKHSCLHNAMAKYGIDKFHINQIAEVPDDELDDTEIRYIQELNTMAPNGYNLTSGGGHFKHNEATIELMRKTGLIAAIKSLEVVRRDETKGLPMYIIYVKRGKLTGFAINNHPLCSYLSFTTVNNRSMDECKQLALEFLKNLEAGGKTYNVQHKEDETLPVGITKFRTGFKVRRKINGIWYTKTFEGINIPDETKLENAMKYLNEIILKE